MDLRVTTAPTIAGEGVVIRLLDAAATPDGLNSLGLSAATAAGLESVLDTPHGMVLVTGPTGSGKTTTLYAALAALNRVDHKIITVEDPVEYRLPRSSKSRWRHGSVSALPTLSDPSCGRTRMLSWSVRSGTPRRRGLLFRLR